MDELQILPCSGKRPHELSVGERQKAAVIRAMIGKPEFLFADEPTAALDIDSALDVMRLLETTMPDTGMVQTADKVPCRPKVGGGFCLSR